MAADRISPGWGARDRWSVAGLIMLAVGFPLLVGTASGSLVVSHNDDFNYRRVALGLYETGTIQLTGWTVMSLIGQLALIQPVLWVTSGAAWSFGVMTGILAAIGVIAGYTLVRRIFPAKWTCLIVLTAVLFPGFLLNTTSFMTDVPAWSCEMASLALGATALARRELDHWKWLVASLAVGCFAFSIREFALAAPIAVLASMAASVPDRRRSYLLAGVVVLATCAVIHFATSHLPGQGTAVLAPFSEATVAATLRAIGTLSLGLSPAIVIGASWWLARGALVDAAAGAAIGVLLFREQVLDVLINGSAPKIIVGNLLLPEGAPGSGAMAGDRPLLFGSPIWDILSVVALIATVIGFAVLGSALGLAMRRRVWIGPRHVMERAGSVAGLLVGFVLIVGGGIILFSLFASVFDRYLWPIDLPLAALLVVRPDWAKGGAPRRSGRSLQRAAYGLSAVLLVGLLLTSAVLTLNSAAFDSARWRMGEEAVARGIPSQNVDAGMEWVGFHSTGTANILARPTRQEMWYDAWWPSFRLCAMVSSSPLNIPGFKLETTDIAAYRLLLIAGPETPLYLYRISNPGCP